MERAIIYTRVSSKNQDDNYSQGQQIQLCTDFVKSQGWEVYQQLHDTQSGTDFYSRENLQKCIELITLGVAQYLTFSAVDRMGRNFGVFEKLTRRIYEVGGKIAIASKNKIYDNYDEFWLQCITDAADSVKEILRLSNRTGSARMKAYLSGSYMKRPPYGYVIKTEIRKTSNGRKEKFNILEVIIPQQESINIILEKYVELKSVTAAAKYANDNKLYNSVELTGEIKTIWSYSTIIKIIDNAEMYAAVPLIIKFRETPFGKDKETGLVKVTKDNPEIPYTFPRIIPDELAQSVALTRKQSQNRINTTSRDKPFKGFVWCKCGRKAYYEDNTNPKHRRFVCASGSRGKQYHTIGKAYDNTSACTHSTSVIFFVEAIKQFLEELDTDSFITRAELSLIESSEAHTIFKMTLEKIAEKKAELIKIRSSIIRNSARLDPEEDIEILRGFAEEVKLLQSEIDELAETYSNQVVKMTKLEKIFSSLGLQWEENISILAEKSKTFQGMVKITPKLTHARETINTLREAVAARNWDAVGESMARLGLRFEADFSLRGKLARRASIRVFFQMESELFPDSGEGEGIAKDTLSGSDALREGDVLVGGFFVTS
ncbi:recombinase family protein [Deinococcus arenicola]|uniref:Recombinase family protein n=1 Tax=Deinococcus arenicola TaxID=2994950 RepID=A0ABU4DLK4_9DEIO|nr:recombinase family protein [Deinococcus sp. ZS9-10]MDV6373311.1 recombinase family protein [Deinococcus sp. ZS9-10]